MADTPTLSPLTLLSRWLVGMGLISWRYLWSTTPLHRSECREETPRLPPDFPDGLPDADLQPWTSGAGPMFHRVFRVRIPDARKSAAELMDVVLRDLGHLVPKEVVRVHEADSADRRLRPGDDLVVDMPGPWNGPVRVAVADPTRLRLATLAGHLEAGQIEFRARDTGAGLVFEIEVWARAADRVVHLLYAHLRLAKEIQFKMWVRFCLAAAKDAGGRADGGVEVRTVITPAPELGGGARATSTLSPSAPPATLTS